jgi:N-acetylneuraminic acid mutarotase
MRWQRTRTRTLVGCRGAVVVAATVVSVAACTAASSPLSSVLPADPAPPQPPASEPARLTTSPVAPTTAPSDPGSPSAPVSVGSGSWVLAGELGDSSIWNSSVVALDDGGALLIRYGEDERMGTERWDAATASWHSTRALERPRTQFAAVALDDDRVLVAGGYNEAEQSYSSAYLYDAASEAWTKTGLMLAARTAPSAALLPDGRVLLAGGYFYQQPDHGLGPPGVQLAAYVRTAEPRPSRMPFDDVDVPPHGYALATAEVFDPATGTWSETGAMDFARSGAAAVTLADGRVLIVGSGSDSVEADWRAFDTAEIYDPRTGEFTMAGSLPEIDRAAIERDGVVLPEGDPAPATVGELVALEDGGALLVAHSGWWKHQGDVVRTFRFDAAGAIWRQVGPAYALSENPTADEVSVTPGVSRVGAFVARLGDGRVLAAGGNGRYAYATEGALSAELFDPATDTWSAAPDLPEPRLFGRAVTLTDGSALIVGGSRDEQTNEGWEQVELRSTLRFLPAG